MKRVMIVGQPGSGKSTLARQIAAATGLPAYHMDHIHWKSGWVEREKPKKINMVDAIIAKDHWVFEGGFSATFPSRLGRADTFIWLDLPFGLRTWRVLRRSWRYRGQSRPDLPEGCPEQFNKETIEFLAFIWRTRRTARIKLEATHQIAQQQGLVTYHFRAQPDIDTFRETLLKD